MPSDEFYDMQAIIAKRDTPGSKWMVQVFKGIIKDEDYPYQTYNGGRFAKILPLNSQTKELVGTTFDTLEDKLAADKEKEYAFGDKVLVVINGKKYNAVYYAPSVTHYKHICILSTNDVETLQGKVPNRSVTVIKKGWEYSTNS